MSKVLLLSVRIARREGLGAECSHTWEKAERTASALKKNMPLQVEPGIRQRKPSQVFGDQ